MAKRYYVVATRRRGDGLPIWYAVRKLDGQRVSGIHTAPITVKVRRGRTLIMVKGWYKPYTITGEPYPALGIG